MVDYFYDGISKNQSKSKLEVKELRKIYNNYHDDENGIDDSNIPHAVSDIQEYMNRIANYHKYFDYKSYIDGFINSYQKHYIRIPEYRKNKLLDNHKPKMGFLIEFHCDTLGVMAEYNGSKVLFNTLGDCQFPMTKDVIYIIEESKELDFVIISQFKEGIDYKPESVLIFEPRNMKESIEKQKIKVYDSVTFFGDSINIELHNKES